MLIMKLSEWWGEKLISKRPWIDWRGLSCMPTMMMISIIRFCHESCLISLHLICDHPSIQWWNEQRLCWLGVSRMEEPWRMMTDNFIQHSLMTISFPSLDDNSVPKSIYFTSRSDRIENGGTKWTRLISSPLLINCLSDELWLHDGIHYLWLQLHFSRRSSPSMPSSRI